MDMSSRDQAALHREKHVGRTNLRVVLALSAALCAYVHPANAQEHAETKAKFFVSVQGNDAWSGKLPAANAGKTDGPFATLLRARDAIREFKAKGGMKSPVTVMVRGGAYYLAKPLVLTAEDSGSEQCSITYRAYPGEKPIISGGRPIAGWKKGEGELWTASIPEVKAGQWYFQQLFVDGKRQIRARHPNSDPKHPTTGGFLFARSPSKWLGGYGAVLGRMYPGDWSEYDFEVPATGTYFVWFRYGALNKLWGTDDIGTDERTTIRLDGGKRIPLRHLPDTGGWRVRKWSPSACARVDLTAGKHVLRWTNDKGPGLDIDAMALVDDPAWKPSGAPPTPPRQGKHLVIIHAECYDRIQGDRHCFSPFGSKQDVHFDAGTLHSWPQSPEKILHVWVFQGAGVCSNALLPIASIDEEQRKLWLVEPFLKNRESRKLTQGARFFVDNVREALDSPGEWYLDRATGTVTHWPTAASPTGCRIVGSRLDRLIELNGDVEKGGPVRFVRFEGFTFEATDYQLQTNHWYHSESAAVWLRDADHCRFAHNSFVNLGGTAIVINGRSTDNEVVGNEVAFTGAGGFTINSQPENIYARQDIPDRARRNRVTGNHIHHIGLIWKHGAGVYLHATSRNIVSHNLIHDTARHPIIMTGNSGGNRIEYNEILRSNLETADTGAIHTYRTDVAKEGNIIQGNVIGDVVGMHTTVSGKILTPVYAWGIYLDGYSSRTVVRNNIVYRTVRGGIMINGGVDNVVENNIFVDSATTQLHFNLVRGRGKNNRFVRNVVAYSDPEATLRGGSGTAPDVVASDHNLFWLASKTRLDLSQVRLPGLDMHSLVADPLFVDPAKDDYRLRPDSPAFKLGFKPIDTIRVGLRGSYNAGSAKGE